ncbi:hypothetical protein X740_33175 [Mesorhizobium sp. LNHC221B00]|nr:hypothetical protein X740_33175 [Mesorhizobium sp. LNHC221B00]
MAFQKNTIAQRIALEGGKAIEDQLKALGDAGEKAFKQIQNAAIKADFGKFSASLSKFGGDLATVGGRPPRRAARRQPDRCRRWRNGGCAWLGQGRR